MGDALSLFETIARRAQNNAQIESRLPCDLHPFDDRNVHLDIYSVSKLLFDDGHYSQATFEAYKLLDRRVQELAKINDTGVKLMMKAFSEQTPLIKLTSLSNTSEKDEQEGYKFIFSGAIQAIRNPRGHEFGLQDSPTLCLDHLSLASLLLRRLELIQTK